MRAWHVSGMLTKVLHRSCRSLDLQVVLQAGSRGLQMNASRLVHRSGLYSNVRLFANLGPHIFQHRDPWSLKTLNPKPLTL